MSNQIYRIDDTQFAKLKTYGIIAHTGYYGVTINRSYGPAITYGDTWNSGRNWLSYMWNHYLYISSDLTTRRFTGGIASFELNDGNYLVCRASIDMVGTSSCSSWSGTLYFTYAESTDCAEPSTWSDGVISETTYEVSGATDKFFELCSIFQPNYEDEDTIIGFMAAPYLNNFKVQDEDDSAYTHIYYGVYMDWAYLADYYDIPLGDDGTPFTGNITLYDNRAFGETSSDEGYGQDEESAMGSFDDSSDDISIPDATEITVNITTSGLFGIYNPTQGEMESLGNELWSSDFIDTIFKAAQAPFDNIVSLHVVPVTPTVTGETPYIKIGNYTSSVTSNVVATDYVTKDCGTLELPEYWANYLDYSGTTIKLWLPFYGFVNVDPSQINGGSINVTYTFNVYSGDYVAYVTCNALHSELNSVTQIYAGNAKIQLPITGADYMRCYTGIIDAVSGVAQAGTGLYAGNATGAMNGLGRAASGAMGMMSPDFQRSGNFSNGGSLMTILTPFLMIDRVGYSVAENYKEESGIPLNVTCKLSSLSGFTQLQDFHLDGISCTMEERELIESALRKGVIL